MGYEIRNLVINDDIIPSKAENDVLNNNNDVYFYATNWTHGTPDDFSGMYNASNFVRDNLDINMNGVTDETILKATAKVLGTTLRVSSLINTSVVLSQILLAAVHSTVGHLPRLLS